MMQAPTIVDIVLSLLPLVLLLGVLLLFLRNFDRQAKALERIATALEKRQ